MKTKVIALVVCVVVLGGLIGASVYLKNKPADTDDLAEKASSAYDTIQLLDKVPGDVTQMTMTANGNTLTFLPAETTVADNVTTITWSIPESQGLKLDQSMINSLVSQAVSFTAVKKLADSVPDPASYGLKPALCTLNLTFSDGGTAEFKVGSPTMDDSNNYVLKTGDPALYMITNAAAKKYLYTLSDLADKSLPLVQTDNLQYFLLKRQDQPAIELTYNTGTDEDAALYGTQTMQMMQPYPGRRIYEGTLVTETGASESMSVDELVEIAPADLSQYGLDQPSMELWMKDSTDVELHLLVGNGTGEDGMVYVKQADNPSVFAMQETLLNKYENLDMMKFMDRFVCLESIKDVDEIHMRSDDMVYDISAAHEEQPLQDGQSAPDVVNTATVNGKALTEDDYKVFYQLLIGLSYDSPIDSFTPASAEPEVEIEYVLHDGTSKLCQYYSYDDNFYAVQTGGEPIQFVVNKASVANVFATLDADMAK